MADIPGDIKKKISVGVSALKQEGPTRALCIKFWRGDQHTYVAGSELKYLATLDSVSATGTPKQRFRMRTTRNYIFPIVRALVAGAVQRVPQYEVNPSSMDPDKVSAARLAEKVAFYGHDRWGVRNVMKDLVTYSLVIGEGFAWPWFDTSKGREIPALGTREGEVRIKTFGANECFWEPGVRFEDARWVCVHQARPISEVKKLPGFDGENLNGDANTDDYGFTANNKNDCVMVTEYLERPCSEYPQGRRVVIANDRQIVPESPYPRYALNSKDQREVLDEPVLHRLSYVSDPSSDRDLGLVAQLIDPQRTVNDCINRQLEWKNLALSPQLFIMNGKLKEPLTEEPGAVYHIFGNVKPEWRPVPQLPPELSAMKDDARADMDRIAAQNDIPAQVDSGKGIQALLERDQGVQQDFIGSVADIYSTIMRHCLQLVQVHYAEGRLLRIRGRFGVETIPNFRGADMLAQTDVTVLPGSIEPRTKADIEKKVTALFDRQLISGEAYKAALNGGVAEALLDGYEFDVARQHREIQTLIALDRNEKLPEPSDGVPDPVPVRPYDNDKVHLDVLDMWMKTMEFETASPILQAWAMKHREDHQTAIDMREQQDAAKQNLQAQSLGMGNAAKPAAPKPLPSLPQ